MEATFITKHGKPLQSHLVPTNRTVSKREQHTALSGVPLFLRSPDLIQRKAEDEVLDDAELLEDEAAIPVQTKLVVGQPDDPLEREADRVAQAAAQPALHQTSPATSARSEELIQRACESCGVSDCSCQSEEDDEDLVQRKETDHAPSPQSFSTSSIATPSAGKPLSRSVKHKVEPLLGADLSQVRVHTDPSANTAAKGLHAKAFTHKNHIWLGPNQSADDVELMAHEATHVVQQNSTANQGNLLQRRQTEEHQGIDRAAIRRRLQQQVDTALSPAHPETREESQAGNSQLESTPSIPVDVQAENAARSVDQGQLQATIAEVTPDIRPSTSSPPHLSPQVEASSLGTAEVSQQLAAPASNGEMAATDSEATTGSAQEASTTATAAANLAAQAFSSDDSLLTPDIPAPVIPPAPVMPVDAGGMPLPGNPEMESEVADLALQVQALREQGHNLRQQASEERANAQILSGNVSLIQRGIEQSDQSVQTSQGHLEFRRGVLSQAQQALTVSEQKAAEVGQQAPAGVSKASEGRNRSGPMASEARGLASENTARTPNDPEAAQNAQQQGSQLNRVGNDAANIDGTIGQVQDAANQLVADAAHATQLNSDTSGKIAATEEALGQTEGRLGELSGINSQAHGQIEEAAGKPQQMAAQAGELDAQGEALIQASLAMEERIHQMQQSYAAGMQSVPVAEQPEESGEDALVQRTPDGQPSSINIAEGLPSWLTGEPEVNEEERLQAQEREEQRRQSEIEEIRALYGDNLEHANTWDRVGMALRLTGRNLFGGLSNISWPGWGGVASGAGHLALSLIDPRAPLMGVVSGLNMVINGGVNFVREPSWGNALKAAADIALGLTIILGSITALAGLIIGIMMAISIVTVGAAAPITGPIIAFCTTVMTTVGTWTFWTGLIAAALQGMLFIKHLYEAATAQSAEALQQQSENMTADARNTGNALMQVAMARMAQVGGRQMRTAIGDAGGGVRFAARLGARGPVGSAIRGVRRAGLGGYSRITARRFARGASGLARMEVGDAARSVYRGVRDAFRGHPETSGRPPAPGGFSREFLVGKEMPAGSYLSSTRQIVREEMQAAGVISRPRPTTALASERPSTIAAEPVTVREPVAPPAERPVAEVPSEVPPTPQGEVQVTPRETQLLEETRTPPAGLEGEGYRPRPGERSMTREEWEAFNRRQRAEASVGKLEGHGHERHGSQTSTAQQVERVQTGRAPDGKKAPTSRGTRFDSPEVELEAVARARRHIETLEASGQLDHIEYNYSNGTATAGRASVVVPGGPGGYGSGVEKISGSTGIPFPGPRPVQTTGQDMNAVVGFQYNLETRRWDLVTQFPTNRPATIP